MTSLFCLTPFPLSLFVTILLDPPLPRPVTYFLNGPLIDTDCESDSVIYTKHKYIPDWQHFCHKKQPLGVFEMLSELFLISGTATYVMKKIVTIGQYNGYMKGQVHIEAFFVTKVGILGPPINALTNNQRGQF